MLLSHRELWVTLQAASSQDVCIYSSGWGDGRVAITHSIATLSCVVLFPPGKRDIPRNWATNMGNPEHMNLKI